MPALVSIQHCTKSFVGECGGSSSGCCSVQGAALAVGASSRTDCLPVLLPCSPPGYYSGPKAAECTACPQGQFSIVYGMGEPAGAGAARGSTTMPAGASAPCAALLFALTLRFTLCRCDEVLVHTYFNLPTEPACFFRAPLFLLQASALMASRNVPTARLAVWPRRWRAMWASWPRYTATLGE